MSREPLDMDLDDFVPRPKAEKPALNRKKAVAVSQFPSREAEDETQFNIRCPTSVQTRFRALAKSEGLKQGKLLEKALDAFERELDE